MHGGGPEITDHAESAWARSPSLSTACAYTDRETADIVQMVLAGKVNKGLVRLLIQSMGGKAIGLCGMDGHMIRGPQARRCDYGYVGEIINVNTQPDPGLRWKRAISPSSPPWAADERGQPLQHQRRHCRRAHRRQPGRGESDLHDRHPRPAARTRTTKAPSSPPFRSARSRSSSREGIISGGMIPKIECCVEAIRRGVKKAFIIDGRVPHSILIEMPDRRGHRHHVLLMQRLPKGGYCA